VIAHQSTSMMRHGMKISGSSSAIALIVRVD
jgi:hypothetical protein